MNGPDGRVLLGAVALDVVFGEPPSWAHPVIAMGKVLAWLERLAPLGPVGRLIYGGAVGVGFPLAWGVVGRAGESHFGWPVQVAWLWPVFAGRMLLGAAEAVEERLVEGDLEGARTQLRALVSRPVGSLDTSHVSAAAVESLAENLVDSWLAPLVAYSSGGLAWAYAYRAINTADAMWGYRSSRFEHLGKMAARIDDAANWIPARLGALLLVLSAGGRARAAWCAARRDGALTASPNAGQPMSAAAGALGVRLEKVGEYVLNLEGREPVPTDIGRARVLVGRAMMLAVVGLWIILTWREGDG